MAHAQEIFGVRAIKGRTEDHQPGGRGLGRRGEIEQSNDALHGNGMRCRTTAANIGGLFRDADEAAAFIISYVHEFQYKIKVFGANDVMCTKTIAYSIA